MLNRFSRAAFIKSALTALVVRVLGAFALFIMNLSVARSLDLSNAGLFFLSFSIFSAIGVICTLGLTHSLLRFVGGFFAKSDWHGINRVFKLGMKWALGCSVVTTGVLFVSVEALNAYFFQIEGFTLVLRIMLVGVPLFVISQLISFVFQGIHRSLRSIFIVSICTPLSLAFFLELSPFLGVELSATSVAFLFGFSTAMTTLIAFVLMVPFLATSEPAGAGEAKELFVSAQAVWQMVIASVCLQYAGQIVLGMFADSSDVAIFAVSQRLAMVISFPLVAINMVAAPRFAAYHNDGDTEGLRSLAKLCGRLMILVAGPLLVVIMIFTSDILRLFGDAYTSGVDVVRILALGQFINVITGSVNFLLNMSGFERDMRNIMIVTGPITILLLVVFTPIMGLYGAAIVTAFCTAGQNLAGVFFVKRRLGFNTLLMFRS